VVVLRNPWDQWASFAGQAELGNHYFAFRSYLIACVACCSGYDSFFERLPLFPPVGELQSEEALLKAYYALPDIVRFQVFLRVFLLDFLLALPEADVVVDLDRLSGEVVYRDEMTQTLRRVTGLDEGLRFDDCLVPRHSPPEDETYREALIEARALLASHPLGHGPWGALLRGKLDEAIDRMAQTSAFNTRTRIFPPRRTVIS